MPSNPKRFDRGVSMGKGERGVGGRRDGEETRKVHMGENVCLCVDVRVGVFVCYMRKRTPLWFSCVLVCEYAEPVDPSSIVDPLLVSSFSAASLRSGVLAPGEASKRRPRPLAGCTQHLSRH